MIRLRRGFTLVEMLVVISIIGMLASLLVPAALKARENGRRSMCANNLHQIMIAMTAYESQYRTLPPGRVGCDCDDSKALSPCKGQPAYKRPGTSGFALILPQLDELPTYQMFMGFQRGGLFPGDLASVAEPAQNNKTSFPDSPCTSSDNTTSGWATIGSTSAIYQPVKKAMNSRIEIFVCPTNLSGASAYAGAEGYTGGASNYAMSMGSSLVNGISGGVMTIDKLKYANNGPFIYRTPRPSSAVFDGLANTIFLGEVTSAVSLGTSSGTNRWAAAWRFTDSLRSTLNGIGNITSSNTVKGDNSGRPVTGSFNSSHQKGAYFAFGDGHVAFLSNTMNGTLFRALGTIANTAQESGYLTPPED